MPSIGKEVKMEWDKVWPWLMVLLFSILCPPMFVAILIVAVIGLLGRGIVNFLDKKFPDKKE